MNLCGTCQRLINKLRKTNMTCGCVRRRHTHCIWRRGPNERGHHIDCGSPSTHVHQPRTLQNPAVQIPLLCSPQKAVLIMCILLHFGRVANHTSMFLSCSYVRKNWTRSEGTQQGGKKKEVHFFPISKGK